MKRVLDNKYVESTEDSNKYTEAKVANMYVMLLFKDEVNGVIVSKLVGENHIDNKTSAYARTTVVQ